MGAADGLPIALAPTVPPGHPGRPCNPLVPPPTPLPLLAQARPPAPASSPAAGPPVPMTSSSVSSKLILVFCTPLQGEDSSISLTLLLTCRAAGPVSLGAGGACRHPWPRGFPPPFQPASALGQPGIAASSAVRQLAVHVCPGWSALLPSAAREEPVVSPWPLPGTLCAGGSSQLRWYLAGGQRDANQADVEVVVRSGWSAWQLLARGHLAVSQLQPLFLPPSAYRSFSSRRT